MRHNQEAKVRNNYTVGIKEYYYESLSLSQASVLLNVHHKRVMAVPLTIKSS